MSIKTQTIDSYRNLTQEDTARLVSQGCQARDWSQILINSQTDLQYINRVRFEGFAKIGVFNSQLTLPGGATFHTGLYNATLSDVNIADNCLIRDVRGIVANVDIGSHVAICSTDFITVESTSPFGEGTTINAPVECGGGQIVVRSGMSVQEALLQTRYPILRRQSLAIARSRHSKRATIGDGTVIVRCGRITGVRIGPAAILEGVLLLENGSIVSTPEQPTMVGNGVIARDFIIESGARIIDGAVLKHCYVGQTTTISDSFSATDTYFSCNCHAEKGESCALLAGPFTVTHHRATLLIGLACSFFNAGSATNQSNHAYKLGPDRAGSFGRGCKTASGTHIVHPSRFAPYSLVMGHIPPHTDTSAFPFSYIIEKKDGTLNLIPAVALRSIGTFRDATKWPRRDARSQTVKRLDYTVFDLFNPHVAELMISAVEKLNTYIRTMDRQGVDTVDVGRCILTLHAAKQGIRLYLLATQLWLSNVLLDNIDQPTIRFLEETDNAIQTRQENPSPWCDLMGLPIPLKELEKIADQAQNTQSCHENLVDDRLADFFKQYKKHVLTRAWTYIKQTTTLGYKARKVTDLCCEVIEKGMQARKQLYEQLISDAQKDIINRILPDDGLSPSSPETDAELIDKLRNKPKTDNDRSKQAIALLKSYNEKGKN